MDKPTRFPFLSEECMRKQRVEVYLKDLKTRMKSLRHLHEEVLQNSVEIINEIDGTATSLTSDASTSAETSRIRRLIRDYENCCITSRKEEVPKEESDLGINVNIRQIMKNFEELNRSCVLKESLMLMQKAKESFAKIDNFLENVNEDPQAGHDAPTNNCHGMFVDGGGGSFNDLHHGCHLQTVGMSDDDQESIYGSCTSSVMSIAVYCTAEDANRDLIASSSKTLSLENGYEGDNDDSEIEMMPPINKTNQ